MKVFDIRLDRRDVFVVYFRDNQITLMTDKDHPYPCTDNVWNRGTNAFHKAVDPTANKLGCKLVFPTYAISKGDINSFFAIHLVEMVKFGTDQKTITPSTNILILTKEWDDVFEIGFGLREGEYSIIHRFGQKIVDRYMNLKVFW